MPFHLSSQRPDVPANQKLWKALVQKDEAGLTAAIAQGADPDVVWKQHTCALTHAVLIRNEAAALRLVEAGAHVWQPGGAQRGRIPIQEAAELGQREVVRHMLGAAPGGPLPDVGPERWWQLVRNGLWGDARLLDDLLDAVPQGMNIGSADVRAGRWARLAHAPKAREAFFKRLERLPFMAFPKREECSERAWGALVAQAYEGHPWVETQVRRTVLREDLFGLTLHKKAAQPLLPQLLMRDSYFFAHERARATLQWLAETENGRRLLAQHRGALLAATATAGSLKRMTHVLDALGLAHDAVATVDFEGKPLLHHAVLSNREPRMRAALAVWLVGQGAAPNERDSEGRTALERHCALFEPREVIVRALVDAGCAWTDEARMALRERQPALAACLAAEELADLAPASGTPSPGRRPRI